MDVDEENAFDGEEGQQSDGNQGTDGGLRRGGRQRKKVPENYYCNFGALAVKYDLNPERLFIRISWICIYM